jgi:hypothetical protein
MPAVLKGRTPSLTKNETLGPFGPLAIKPATFAWGAAFRFVQLGPFNILYYILLNYILLNRESKASIPRKSAPA